MSRRSRRKHASMREMFDAGDDLGPSVFDDVELGERDAEDVEQDLDEDLPRVVMCTIQDLGTKAPEAVAKLGERPVWFINDEHAELVGVFERYPEEASTSSSAVLSFLRSFSTSTGEGLQALLGPASSLRYGFHTTASLAEVVESFEDDGFDVLLGIRDGEVQLPDGDD